MDSAPLTARELDARVVVIDALHNHDGALFLGVVLSSATARQADLLGRALWDDVELSLPYVFGVLGDDA
jgi:hypothetical protein